MIKAILYGMFFLLVVIFSLACFLLKTKKTEVFKENLVNNEGLYSQRIVKSIKTRNTYPRIGDQFKHLEEFQNESGIEINFNLERYIL